MIDEAAANSPTRRWTTSTSSRRKSCSVRLLPKYVAIQIFRGAAWNRGRGARSPYDCHGCGHQQRHRHDRSLTLAMNRARQAKITKEIIEIVSGARRKRINRSRDSAMTVRTGVPSRGSYARKYRKCYSDCRSCSRRAICRSHAAADLSGASSRQRRLQRSRADQTWSSRCSSIWAKAAYAASLCKPPKAWCAA